MRVLRPRSLAGQLFAMQVVLVALLVAGCAVYASIQDRGQARESARQQATATALAVADSPSVRKAIRTEHPTRTLQPYAERVRQDTGVTFITIMDPEGTRWTHPNPERIGGTFVGHRGPALEGRTFHETYTGTLGPSVRVVTPVRDDGRIVGLVSAGIAVDRISAQVAEQVTALLGVAGLALTLGGVGTYWVNARLRRHTHGMNATELSRMHDYHEATLHAVREGLVMLDGQRRIALINDGARALLGLHAPAGGDATASDDATVGRYVADLGLPPSLTGALLASEPRVDEVHLTDDRVVVVNTSPVTGGERRGTVVTLRDHTELQTLTGELDSARGLAEALRSQAHEAANRLHTVVSLIELDRAQEAMEFATEELELAQALTDQVVAAVAEPVLAALLLGKAAQANERGVELTLTPDSRIDDGLVPPELPSRDLVTVVGNLVDNAVDASARVADGAAPDGSDGPDAPGLPRPAPRTAGAPAAAEDAHGTRTEGAGALPDTTEHVAGTSRAAGARGRGRGTTSAPARVTVTVRVREDGTDRARELLVRVADSGHGIDPADADAVFHRGWSTKGDPGGRGRGLGLALVRQTARRHGGDVTLAEAPGGGAEFTVVLPLGPAAPGTAGPPRPRTGDTARTGGRR
ncbi:sensor histidine kinase [Streptomyces sp. DSM 42041]|uniref:histidine kinase n=1 Tax=Streptomyces hazeniae TaxID=3075538 RepID=A0ABU2NUW7_9ACTN|nr:sensor histidine kinase [Streptomyces sp. DSM 42041]MDT0380765.1 sensor histidine kinase [Streptomyces sp. DSM 42041]